MKRGALTQRFHTWSFGISVDLLNRFFPLFSGRSIRSAFRQHLEFENIAVLRLVVREVWKKEEIALAMIEFQLRCRVIIIRQVEIGHEETLQIALCLNAVAN